MITLYGDHVIKLDSGPRTIAIAIFIGNELHWIECRCLDGTSAMMRPNATHSISCERQIAFALTPCEQP